MTLVHTFMIKKCIFFKVLNILKIGQGNDGFNAAKVMERIEADKIDKIK